MPRGGRHFGRQKRSKLLAVCVRLTCEAGFHPLFDQLVNAREPDSRTDQAFCPRDALVTTMGQVQDLISQRRRDEDGRTT